MYRARAEDYFAVGHGLYGPPSAVVLDADSAAFLEQHTPRMRVRYHAKIGTLARFVEKSSRSRPPATPVDRKVDHAEAFLPRAVEILALAIAGFNAGTDECRIQRVLRARQVHAQRTVLVVELPAPRLVPFRLQEIRQHVFIAPARVAEVTPVIEIGRVAAQVLHAIERRGTADHLPTRPDLLATVGFLVFGLQLPAKQPSLAQRLACANRNADQRAPVLAAGLQQQDLARGIFRQPCGHDAAG